MASKPVDPIAKLTQAVEKLTKEVGDLKETLKKQKTDHEQFVDDVREAFEEYKQGLFGVSDSSRNRDGKIEERIQTIEACIENVNEERMENIKTWIKNVDDARIKAFTNLLNEIKRTDKWVEEERDRLDKRIDKLEEKIEEQESDNACNLEDLRQDINYAVDKVAETEEDEAEEAQPIANPQEGGFFAWLTGAPKCGKCGRRCRVSNQNGSQFMHQQYVRGANGLELNNIMKESYSCEFCGSTTTTANNYRV